MPASIKQSSFAGGEISPALWGRTDLAKYRTGAAYMRNFFSDYRGGAVSRGGTSHVGMGQPNTQARPRLIPFVFNDEQRYILEFSTKPDGTPRMRVIEDQSYQTEDPVSITAVTRSTTTTITAAGHGLTTQDDFYVESCVGLVRTNGINGLNGRQLRVSGTSGNNVTASDEFNSAIVSSAWTAYTGSGQLYKITSYDLPWLAADYFELMYVQQGDVMTVTHPDYRSYNILRNEDGTWTIEAETFGSSLTPPTGVEATASTTDDSGRDFLYAYCVTTFDPTTGDESVASEIATVVNKALDQIEGVTNRIDFTPSADGLIQRVYKAPVVPNGVAGADQGVWGLIGEPDGNFFVDINYAPDYTVSPPKSYNPFAEGSITEITLLTGGQGYVAPQIIFYGAGQGAQGNVNSRNTGPGDDGQTDPFGEITSIALVNGGQGYTTATTASIADTVISLGSGAELSFSGSWTDLGGGNYAPSPGSITILNGGVNYHRFASTGITASPTVGNLAISDLGTVQDTGSDSQANFSFGSFGTTASDRYLVAMITARDSASDFGASSITIGGVAATIVANNDTGDSTNAILAYALVPTGASGSVVVNWTEAVSDDQLCTLLRVTGLGALFDSDNANASSSATSISDFVNVPAGGVIFSVAACAGTATATWTLANEVADQNATDSQHAHTAAYEVFSAASTPETVGVTWSGSQSDRCIAMGAFYSVSSSPLSIATEITGGILTGISWNFNTAISSTNSAGLSFSIVDLGSTGATVSVETGSANNPRCVAYFQQRKFYAGGAAPRGFFGTRPGQFNNFDYSYPSQDDDPILGFIVGNDVNEILSLVPMSNGMIAFTSSTAFLISGGTSRGAITPANATAIPQSTTGAAPLVPIVIGNDIIYLQSRGSAVSSINYDFYRDGLDGDDLTQLAQHLLQGATIVDWCWAREPWRLLWAVRDDGVLLSFTYVRKQEVYAWAHHDTMGSFVSVATIPEGEENAVYVVAERLLAGSTPYYVTERMHTRTLNGNPAANQPSTTEGAWCVDNGAAYPLTYPNATLSVTSVNDPGEIYALSIDEGGEDYPDVPTVTVDDPTGSGAVITATAVAGVLSTLTIVDGGAGYTNPALVISGGTGAEVSITLGNIFVLGATGVGVANVGSCLRFGGGSGTVVTGSTNSITVNMDVMPHSFYPNDPRTPTRYTRLAYAPNDWSLTAPVTVVGGLDHLRGAYVTGLADGLVIEPQLIDTNGSITLDTGATAIVAGLGYTCQLMTLRFEEDSSGTVQGRRKVFPAVTLRVVDTAQLAVGPAFNMLQEMQLQTNIDDSTPGRNVPFSIPGGGYSLPNPDEDNAAATVTPIFYKDYRIILDSIWQEAGVLCVEQAYPLPAMLLDVIPIVNIGDDEDPGDA